MLLWLVALGTIAAILFAPYNLQDHPRVASHAEVATFMGLHRTAWAVALGLIVILCCTGNGGTYDQAAIFTNRRSYLYCNL